MKTPKKWDHIRGVHPPACTCVKHERLRHQGSRPHIVDLPRPDYPQTPIPKTEEMTQGLHDDLLNWAVLICSVAAVIAAITIVVTLA